MIFALRNTAEPSPGADAFLPHRDALLRHRDEGSGPAVVLVHGWALDLAMWEPQVAALARRWRVLRMDRRGFGRSSGTPGLDADALDLCALLDHAGIERAVLLGMSQGARVVLAVTRAAPQRVAGLILDGAPADDRLLDGEWEKEIPLAHYRRILRARGIEALRSELAQHPLMRLSAADPAARRLLAEMIGRYPAADLAAGTGRGAAMPAAPLAELRLPVLVLNGEQDTLQRLRVGEALCAAIPGAERVLVPRAGHLANLDNPAEYNAALIRFLAGNPRAST